MIIKQAPLSAQITLEQVYPNASVKLSMVNFEFSGMKYMVKNIDPGNRYLTFYNLDHSLWKTIDCNTFPGAEYCGSPGSYSYYFDPLYIFGNPL